MAKKRNGGGPGNGQARPRKKKKGGGLWTVVVSALITVIAGIILLAFFGDKIPRRFRPQSRPEVGAPLPKPQAAASRDVSLYFSGEDGLYLKAEKRTIRKGTIETEIKEAVTELLGGPTDKRLARAVPAGTRLRGFHIKDGTAFVDLSREIVEKNPGGSEGEIQTIYSIVNTIALNFPEIKDVQLLVEGRKESTIAGHIDITSPLAPDRTVIRKG